MKTFEAQCPICKRVIDRNNFRLHLSGMTRRYGESDPHYTAYVFGKRFEDLIIKIKTDDKENRT